MLPLFPYDVAKVVTVSLHSKYLCSFYAKESLFLIYINSSTEGGFFNGAEIGFLSGFIPGRFSVFLRLLPEVPSSGRDFFCIEI